MDYSVIYLKMYPNGETMFNRGAVIVFYNPNYSYLNETCDEFNMARCQYVYNHVLIVSEGDTAEECSENLENDIDEFLSLYKEKLNNPNNEMEKYAMVERTGKL